MELIMKRGKETGKELQKQVASDLSKNKKVMLVFEDETIVTQKPCIRKSINEF
jgi:hypothetical protein